LAKKILKTVENKKMKLLEPMFIKFVPLLKGILPTFVMDFVNKILRVNSALKTCTGRN